MLDHATVIMHAAAVLTGSCFAAEEETVYGVTFWVVADIERASGRQILLNALKHMVSRCSCLLPVGVSESLRDVVAVCCLPCLTNL